jgi:hypothetical protein
MQIVEFFANRSRLETIDMYQHLRAYKGLETAEPQLPQRPRNGKRCCDFSNPDAPVPKKPCNSSAEKTLDVPRTRPGGCFFVDKGAILLTLKLQHEATPIPSCLQFPWGASNVQPPPPLEVRGINVREVRNHFLPYCLMSASPDTTECRCSRRSSWPFNSVTLVARLHRFRRKP